MSRETETFRDHVWLIYEHFGKKAVITFQEVQEFTGQSWKWCNRWLPIPHNGCTVIQLAYALEHLPTKEQKKTKMKKE